MSLGTRLALTLKGISAVCALVRDKIHEGQFQLLYFSSEVLELHWSQSGGTCLLSEKDLWIRGRRSSRAIWISYHACVTLMKLCLTFQRPSSNVRWCNPSVLWCIRVWGRDYSHCVHVRCSVMVISIMCHLLIVFADPFFCVIVHDVTKYGVRNCIMPFCQLEHIHVHI